MKKGTKLAWRLSVPKRKLKGQVVSYASRQAAIVGAVCLMLSTPRHHVTVAGPKGQIIEVVRGTRREPGLIVRM